MPVKGLLVAVATSSLLFGCSGTAFIDEVTVVNDTDYSAKVEVSDETRSGWLMIATVGPQSTHTVEEVIDQGEVWSFRFDYIGKHEEEVEASRRELEQDDWAIEVPQSFEQRLRELGIPPPP